MRTAGEDLADRRPALDAPPFRALVGRFHSHVTLRVPIGRDPCGAARLEALARRHGAKVTVVDLDRFDVPGEAVRDVMTTRYHVDPEPGALGRIAAALQALCDDAARDGLPAVRVKVEHETEPSLAAYDEEHYHEVHVKLDLDEAAFDADRAWLAAQAPAQRWVPSRNPNERRAGRVLQFVTVRIHEGDRAAADRRVEGVLAAIAARGLHVVEVKRETTVLDTRRDHDRWWEAAPG